MNEPGQTFERLSADYDKLSDVFDRFRDVLQNYFDEKESSGEYSSARIGTVHSHGSVIDLEAFGTMFLIGYDIKDNSTGVLFARKKHPEDSARLVEIYFDQEERVKRTLEDNWLNDEKLCDKSFALGVLDALAIEYLS